MSIYIESLDSSPKIQKEIIDAFLREVNSNLQKNVSKIEVGIREIITSKFKKSDVYNALTKGSLKYEFGFPKGQELTITDNIVDRIGDSLQITLKPYFNAGRINIGLSIGIMKSDFSEILGLSDAKVDLASGEQLPWLEWLLTAGDQILIVGYEIQYNNTGRSGGAIMAEKVGSFWKVPAQFSGTDTDNWITRTLYSQDFLDSIGSVIDKNI